MARDFPPTFIHNPSCVGQPNVRFGNRDDITENTFHIFHTNGDVIRTIPPIVPPRRSGGCDSIVIVKSLDHIVIRSNGVVLHYDHFPNTKLRSWTCRWVASVGRSEE